MRSNGLNAFTFHVDSDATGAAAGLTGPTSLVGMAAIEGVKALDAETVARTYLEQGLASEALPQFTVDPAVEKDVDFRLLSTETIPLTKCQAVKFRQRMNKIPVYGSLVTVEMDDGHSLVSINSALGTPSGVDPVAKVAPAAVAESVRTDAGIKQLPAESLPRLFFFFDEIIQQWRLTYIAENVPVSPKESAVNDSGSVDDAYGTRDHRHAFLPELFDYIVDAHSGEIVTRLPRVATVQSQTITVNDSLNNPREVRVVVLEAGALRLEDRELNVHTYDAAFKDVSLGNALPGDYCGNWPTWATDAVSAHANGAAVASFVRDVLMRNGLDNRGEGYRATINCLWGQSSSKEWRNAAWYRDQMIYGQRQQGGGLVSYAVALDVVAHEFFHGITDRAARLQYSGEAGALNESYSDIFGIIISNLSKPNLDNWNWEMGEELDGTGIPLRDFRNPSSRNQPEHMHAYVDIPPPFHQFNDFGGVHTNSGIHNKAAFNMLTARDAGKYMFAPVQVAQIFYLALSTSLSSTATFADSRRAVISSARSLLRADEKRGLKIVAIERAFDSVGIAA